MNDLVNQKIDFYAEYIKEAVENDDIRWKFTEGTFCRAGTYQTWETDVRYLKYFMTQRLQFLAELWGTETIENQWISSGDTHVVRFFVNDKEIKKTEVLDGESISDYPEIEGANWCFDYSGEKYNDFLPVLEDCSLHLAQQACNH